MDLLKMLVVPMVFVSIIIVIINMDDDNLGTLPVTIANMAGIEQTPSF